MSISAFFEEALSAGLCEATINDRIYYVGASILMAPMMIAVKFLQLIVCFLFRGTHKCVSAALSLYSSESDHVMAVIP